MTCTLLFFAHNFDDTAFQKYEAFEWAMFTNDLFRKPNFTKNRPIKTLKWVFFDYSSSKHLWPSKNLDIHWLLHLFATLKHSNHTLIKIKVMPWNALGSQAELADLKIELSQWTQSWEKIQEFLCETQNQTRDKCYLTSWTKYFRWTQ